MEILHDNAAVDLLKKGKQRGLSHRYKLYLIGNFISKKVYMNPNSQFLTTLLFGLNTYFFKLLHGRLFKLYFISRFIDIST